MLELKVPQAADIEKVMSTDRRRQQAEMTLSDLDGTPNCVEQRHAHLPLHASSTSPNWVANFGLVSLLLLNSCWLGFQPYV